MNVLISRMNDNVHNEENIIGPKLDELTVENISIDVIKLGKRNGKKWTIKNMHDLFYHLKNKSTMETTCNIVRKKKSEILVKLWYIARELGYRGFDAEQIHDIVLFISKNEIRKAISGQNFCLSKLRDKNTITPNDKHISVKNSLDKNEKKSNEYQ